jgi:predicted deacetylase
LSPAAPRLLVSIHDVSPLTWERAAQAVDLTARCGVPADALTVLVVPRHEGSPPLAENPAFVEWLRGLAARGATLVAHGLTHRMRRRARLPHRLFWAYVFAAGQGEFYTATRDEAEGWLGTIREDFAAAGLGDALAGFVPPAWLLSRGARDAVGKAGFEFVETMPGIRFGGRIWAPRLIGWGARVRLESWLTAAHARLQVMRRLTDTRLTIHPPDMGSPVCRRSIARSLGVLLPRMRALSYRRFLAEVAAATPSSRAPITA